MAFPPTNITLRRSKTRRACPECKHTSTQELNSNNQSDGTRYRRFQCISCSHKWTVWELNEEQIAYFRLVKKLMKHTCPKCDGTTFQVVKTFPYTRFTLRQLKCRSCGENFYTHEYIMKQGEYCWQMIDGKSRLRLTEQ